MERGRERGRRAAGNQHAASWPMPRPVWTRRWKRAKDAPDVHAAEARNRSARAAAEARARRRRRRARAVRTTPKPPKPRRATPLEAAEREVQRLSAEVKALGDLLHPEGEGLFPPLVDAVDGAVRL